MKIGIAIVNYGDEQLLKNCLESLNQNNVVPNPFFISTFDCNKQNIGFTAGNNKIIQKFLQGIDVPWNNSPPEWIWLLNNDVTLPKETLESIEKILPTIESNIGIIGFKILSMDNPDLIHHGGTLQCYPAGVHKSGSVKLKQLNKRTSEKWVTFASVLIRREVFEQIGLLDEKMVNYYSDSDFCLRARYAGWKIIYEPSFVINHKIGQSQSPSLEQQRVIQTDSIAFTNKWLNGKVYFDLDKELIRD